MREAAGSLCVPSDSEQWDGEGGELTERCSPETQHPLSRGEVLHSTSDRKWNRAGRRPFLLLFCFYLATDSRTVNTDDSLRMVPF